jgi:hypothetical protein
MIDQEGNTSLEKGADNIRLTGNEGVSSPAQEMIKAGIPKDLTMDQAFEVFIKSEGRPPKDIPELLEFFKNMTLSEGPPLPNDPTEPVNPFGPKPIGPVLPDRQMAAFGGIMGLDQRRQYGIGSSFKKALNKVTRPFTKVARKLVPKEIAGPLRTIAPFLPPGFREAAYLAGTAKQKGRFNIGDLAFAAAPYARFSQAAPGQGTFGTDTDFRFGTAQSGDYGIRDLITGGERGGAYEQRGGEGILGKIKLGESDLGQMSDEFIFGKPAQTREITPRQKYDIEGLPKNRSQADIDAYIKNLSPSEQLKLENLADKYEGLGIDDYESITNVSDKKIIDNILFRPDVTKTMYDSATPGILGMGGEMSVLGGAGGAPGITKSILGDKAFLGKDGKLSMLKLGSWGVGIVSGIKAGKYRDAMEAAQAAEDALLAENQAATEAEIQAARDWAIETFGSMSVYADGGRINKYMGGGFEGLGSMQRQDVTPPGMELDLRVGGFIPIGKAEKADDVKARVSKNEFVFTADAVKAAGGGSVNEGAKRMYDTMKRLESQVV